MIRWPDKRTVLWGVVIFNLLCLALPTPVASFTAGDFIRFPPDRLSLRWYGRRLLERTEYQGAFLRSVYVAVICTLVSIPSGTLAALATARYRFRCLRALQVYFLLPFPPIAAPRTGRPSSPSPCPL